MNILTTPRRAYNFDRIWNTVKRTFLRSDVQVERDLPLAMDLHGRRREKP